MPPKAEPVTIPMLLARLKSAVTANEEFDAWLQHPLPPGGAAPDVIAMMSRHAIENWRETTASMHATLAALSEGIDDLEAALQETESDLNSARESAVEAEDDARDCAFEESRVIVRSIRADVAPAREWSHAEVLDLVDRIHDTIGEAP